MTAPRRATRALIPLTLATVSALLLLTISGGPAAAQELTIEGTAENTWEPAELQVNPGDTVTFTITGGATHPVAPAAGGPTFDASACGVDAMQAVGDSCEITFEQEGTFPFICTVHEALGMTGTITVGEGGGNGAPATPAPEESTTTVLDTPAAAPPEEGPPIIYYAGWGLLALGGLLALAAVVGYLRFAPDFRRSDK